MVLESILPTWLRVLTNPSEETFAQEKMSPQANVTTALIWIVIAAVISGMLGFMQSLLFGGVAGSAEQILRQADLPPEMMDQMLPIMETMMGSAVAGFSSLVATIIITPLVFLIFTGLFHLIATVLGGQGEFGRLAYLFAAFQAPITIVNGFLGFIPLAGGCLVLLLTIYSMVLGYFAVKVNYHLSSGRALVVILIPLGLGLLLMACGIFALTGIIMAGMQ